MIRQKSDGKNQTGQGLKILVPDQMLSRLPISLAQLKAGNNSERLKKEIRQLLYCLYQYYLKMGTIFMNTENSKTNVFMNLLTSLILKTQIKILHWLI